MMAKLYTGLCVVASSFLCGTDYHKYTVFLKTSLQPSGNPGCYGGWAHSAFTNFIDLPDIATEDSYPYEAMMNGRLFLMTILLMVAVVRCLDKCLDDRWGRFKTTNNRKYKKEEEAKRRDIWETKIREIEQHNKEADLGNHSYWMRETEWDDPTFEEFWLPDNWLDFTFPPRTINVKFCTAHDDINNDELPVSKDWTKEGFLTSVKNQKPGLTSCGTCWAFAAVGAAEGQLFKKTNMSVNLSAQSLVDCSVRNYGCKGGLSNNAFVDFMDLSGIATEESYPYEAKQGTCRLFFAEFGARIEDCKITTTHEELINAVAYVGPVIVSILSGPKFQNLGDGIYTDCAGYIRHAVLAVGYGVHNGKEVWRIKKRLQLNLHIDIIPANTQRCLNVVYKLQRSHL